MIGRRYISLRIGRAKAPPTVLLALLLTAPVCTTLSVSAAEPPHQETPPAPIAPHAEPPSNQATTHKNPPPYKEAAAQPEPIVHPKPVAHRETLKETVRQAATRYSAGDYLGAIAAWSRIIQRGPERETLFGYVQRAKVKRHMGDHKGAVQDLDLALASEPTYFAALVERAALRRRLGDNRGALADLDKAIEIQPHKAEPYVERGWLKMAMADYVGSYTDYHSAVTINPNLKSKLAGMAHPQVSGHLDMDANGIHKDIETEARHAPAIHANYDTAADWAPHGPPPTLNQTQLARLNNAAVKEINSGQFEAAVKTLHELIEAAPDYANARKNLTIAYNNWGLELAKRTPALAARQFRQALFLDPSQGASRRNLEAMIKEIGKNPHEAEDRLDLARESLSVGDRQGCLCRGHRSNQAKE